MKGGKGDGWEDMRILKGKRLQRGKRKATLEDRTYGWSRKGGGGGGGGCNKLVQITTLILDQRDRGHHCRRRMRMCKQGHAGALNNVMFFMGLFRLQWFFFLLFVCFFLFFSAPHLF